MDTKTTKKPAKKAPCKPVATPLKPRGNLSANEIQPLIMAARAAYDFQSPGVSFNEWRAEEVMAAVARPGLTACDHDHFCDLMGHFKTGAGMDDEALTWFLKGSKNTERQLAWSIAETLTAHLALAHSTAEQITATTPPRQLKRRLDRHAALLDHPEGPLSFDYLVAIVRDKTRRPDLTLTADLKTSLAERCKAAQLAQIRFTLINRISEREGRGHTADRNRSQNSDAAKSRRSPHTLDPRF